MARQRRLTHLDARGQARMVDVGDKEVTRRQAVATARVRVGPEVLRLIVSGGMPKGDVFATARLAGIMAAKNTSELIPLCHPLPIDSAEVELVPEGEDTVLITATVRVTARTGVEMEALTAASAAALTVYDMCKAVARDMEIGPVRLERKTGGRSGDYVRASIPRTRSRKRG